MLRNTIFILLFSLSATLFSQVKDQQFPLAPNSIKLHGNLENDIQNSLVNWNKGVLPYATFVDLFRVGRTQFALGEMWGKATRSASLFYRYTQDPELKTILDETVKDLLSTERPNGSISCSPIEKQPESATGDIWERKYVMLGLMDYYDWVNHDPAVLQSLIRQADCVIDKLVRLQNH